MSVHVIDFTKFVELCNKDHVKIIHVTHHTLHSIYITLVFPSLYFRKDYMNKNIASIHDVILVTS